MTTALKNLVFFMGMVGYNAARGLVSRDSAEQCFFGSQKKFQYFIFKVPIIIFNKIFINLNKTKFKIHIKYELFTTT